MIHAARKFPKARPSPSGLGVAGPVATERSQFPEAGRPNQPATERSQFGPILGPIRRSRFGALVFVASLIALGCIPPGDPRLVIATTWTVDERAKFETSLAGALTERTQFDWVALAPGENLESVVDRRGGVDLVLGGPWAVYDRLEKSKRLGSEVHQVLRWRAGSTGPRPNPWASRSVGRIDPDLVALARERLHVEGWEKGYESLVREAVGARALPVSSATMPVAPVRVDLMAVIRGGRHEPSAAEVIRTLVAGKVAHPCPEHEKAEAIVDDLVADLMTSTLVDAREELLDAASALEKFQHPAKAEEAFGDLPPWPPASVAKLQGDLEGKAMVETLLGQLAPDGPSRDWLSRSWDGPARRVDRALLTEIAGAAGGRLAREPRFRAWLRGEWTAWNRQLYRRVARVAGGYVPS